MKEVEIKVRNIDKESLIKKLEALGAKKVFSAKVVDYRFDTKTRTLSKQGKALRIRQKGKYTFFNLKGKKKSIQNIIGRDEIGVKISSFKTMHRILIELGYIKIFELERIRTEYRNDEIKFDIDEYTGMDPILEIEGTNYEIVQKYVKKLNIQKKDLGRLYIREILAARKKFEEEKKKSQASKSSNENK